MGKELMSKKPEILITDGLQAYKDAFQKEYGSNKRYSKHISAIKLKGNMNNNKMERINGEIRDREKTMHYRAQLPPRIPILTSFAFRKASLRAFPTMMRFAIFQVLSGMWFHFINVGFFDQHYHLSRRIIKY